MKTLQQHIEEKLVINKNSQFDDETYESLNEIFNEVYKSKHCAKQNNIELFKKVKITILLKRMWPKIFMQFEDSYIWSEYSNFIREYNQKNFLDSLEDCNISKGVMYVNDEGWYIKDKAFDYEIFDFLSEHEKIKKIKMFNGEYTCFVYEDKNFFILTFYDNFHTHLDGFIGIKFK